MAGTVTEISRSADAPWPVHPAANIFPMMSDAEIQELAADIRAHGLRERVRLYRGQLLDGRNRVKACQIAEVPVKTHTLPDEDDPLAYVFSQNMRRRHLTATQRAFIAERALPLYEQQAKARQKKAGAEHGRGQQSDGAEIGGGKNSTSYSRRARSEAADQFKVNARYVSDAKKIRSKAPEVADMAERGEISMTEAKAMALEDKPAPAERKSEPRRVDKPLPTNTARSRAARATEASVRSLHEEGFGTGAIAEKLNLQPQHVTNVKRRIGLTRSGRHPLERWAESAQDVVDDWSSRATDRIQPWLTADEEQLRQTEQALREARTAITRAIKLLKTEREKR